MFDRYPRTVTLKDGGPATIRLLAQDDFDKLLDFVEALPEEDRLFLPHGVSTPKVVRERTEELDLTRVIPIVAFEGDNLIGEGFLHFMPYEWMRHVGWVRLATARSHRDRGLGGLIMRELVWLAAERNLGRLLAYTTDDNAGAIKMYTALGFQKAGALKRLIKDRSGKTRDMAIMVNDVADLDRILEDWIQFSTLPGYRAPGDGA